MDKQENAPSAPAAGIDSAEKAVPSIKVKASPFVLQMAQLMFYGKGLRSIKFEELDEPMQAEWVETAAEALVAISKMNKMLVDKVDHVDAADQKQKHLDRLTGIVDDFNKGLKTTKPELYPSRELAYRILEGK